MRQTVKLSFTAEGTIPPTAAHPGFAGALVVVEVVSTESLPVGACVVKLPGQAPRHAHGVATADTYAIYCETQSQAESSAARMVSGATYAAQVSEFGFVLFEVPA